VISYLEKSYGCAMEMTLDLIGGKWKALILWHLAEDGTLRFGELRRLFPKLTQKMLTQQIRDLERDGLVHREIFRQVPPRVDYSLTDTGRSLVPVLTALNGWGREFVNTPCFRQYGSIESACATEVLTPSLGERSVTV